MTVVRPEISVVTAAYNGARYLRQAIDSILTQQGVSFELVVVNDGSTDETGDILRHYEAVDARVVVINQENAGLTASLIRGCQIARGEFIARQDADDVSLPGRLKKQRGALLEDSSLVFVSSSAQGIGPNGELLEVVNRPEDPETATFQLLHEKMGPPAHGTVMMRRAAYEATGGYRGEFYFAQDSDLWLRLGRLGKLKYLPEILYQWRVSPEGISSTRNSLQWRFGDLGQACHAAVLRGDDETRYLTEAAQLSTQIRRDRCQFESTPGESSAWGLYRLGTTLARQGDPRALGYFWQTVRAQPLHLRAWVRLAQSLVLTGKSRRRGDRVG